DGAAVEREGAEGVHVGRALGEHEVGDPLGERGELLVSRDEVGLGVDLDEGAGLAVGRGGRGDDALGGLAVGALGGHLLALLAEDLDGGVEVAAGLLERPLAVHHADAGGLAEALDVLGGDLAHGVPGLREGERGNGGKGEGVGARPPPLTRSPSPPFSARGKRGGYASASSASDSRSAASSSASAWRVSASASAASASTSPDFAPSATASAMVR